MGLRINSAAWERGKHLAITLALCLLAANCGGYDRLARKVDPVYGVAASPRAVEDGAPIPRGGGYFRVGEPYVVAGRTYVPAEDPNYRAEGIASWYGDRFHGRLTANGEIFDKNAISAAHPTLPIPSYVRVTNVANRRSIIVRVNDRGPFARDRIIDLSSRTADLLAFRKNGVARVQVEYVGRAKLTGSDDTVLLATLRQDGRPAPAPSQIALASAAPAAGPVSFPSGPVPSPQDRPYLIGRYPVTAAVAARPAISPSPAPAPAATPATFVPASPAFTPVSANSGAISGRGLY